jgi:hypothetical protein
MAAINANMTARTDPMAEIPAPGPKYAYAETGNEHNAAANDAVSEADNFLTIPPGRRGHRPEYANSYPLKDISIRQPSALK